MLSILLDGKYHSPLELRNCLADDLSEHATVAVHISRLRKKLPDMTDIVFRDGYYRHVQFTS